MNNTLLEHSIGCSNFKTTNQDILTMEVYNWTSVVEMSRFGLLNLLHSLLKRCSLHKLSTHSNEPL